MSEKIEHPKRASECEDQKHEGSLVLREKNIAVSYSEPHSLAQGDIPDKGSYLVNGETLKDLILSQDLKTDMSLLVLILAGLKDCGKTDVLEHVFKEWFKPKGEKKKLSKVGERNKEGLSWYEVAVTGDSAITPTFEWSFFKRSSGYLHCFVSALLQYADRNKLCIQTEQPPHAQSNDGFFGDPTLDEHYCTILEGLHSHFSTRDHEEEDRNFLAGLSLVNVWDLESQNIAVKLVLSILVGHLTYSFAIFGHNLADHVRVPKVADCLELLRFAHLTQGRDAQRDEVCIAAGLITSTQMTNDEDEAELKSVLKTAVASNAKILGVEKCISETPQILNSKKQREIKQLLEELVVRHHSARSIPLSWILLRSAYFKSGVLYVEKKKLQEVAAKLRIEGESFKQFLADFTAMGSIIYNPLIPEMARYVILNPVDFCYRLNSLFKPRFDGDLKKGIVPMSYLRRIFGSDADFFRDVLTSSKQAIEIDPKKIIYLDRESQPPFSERPCYFIPIISKKTSEVEKKSNSLFLQVKSTFLPNNVGQMLAQRLLLDASISLIPSKYSNIVSFEYKPMGVQNSVRFNVISHIDACEISLDLSDDSAPSVVKDVRSLVLGSCLYLVKDVKEYIPYGTEVKDVGVMCATSGRFHFFPSQVSCQECKGPFNNWYHIYSELIEEVVPLQNFFECHPEVTPEVLTQLGKELVIMCSSGEERSKLMASLGQPEESFTQSTFALHITGALQTCAGRKGGKSEALHTILNSLNPIYGKSFRKYLLSL